MALAQPSTRRWEGSAFSQIRGTIAQIREPIAQIRGTLAQIRGTIAHFHRASIISATGSATASAAAKEGSEALADRQYR